MSSGEFRVPAGLTLRRAASPDNDAILEFMRAQSMDAGLQLRFERAPDYFALHNAHSGDHETWLLSDQQQILASASFVQRQAWLDGQSEPVIYMADLRIARRRSVAGIWRALMPQMLGDIYTRTGARLAYCSILRNNLAARNALLRRDLGAAPAFEHLRGYANVTVVARKPWARRAATDLVVRRARREDVEPLRLFIDEQSKATQFGPVFDAEFFSRRLNSWPDFGIENFFLACNEADEVVGCVAPWDSSSINRIVLERLSTSASIVRHLCNLLSPLTCRPWIDVGPNSALPDIGLTHVFVRDRSAHVLRALLDEVQTVVFSSQEYATMSLCLYDDDPLWDALRGYWHIRTPMDLYFVARYRAAGGDGPAFVTDEKFPGFESYLV